LRYSCRLRATPARDAAHAARTEMEDDMTLLTLAIVVFVLGTLVSLALGVSTMATGHEVAHHSADDWMFLRVGFQAGAVLLLLVALYLQ
jgi:hypothetical protein